MKKPQPYYPLEQILLAKNKIGRDYFKELKKEEKIR